MNKKRISYSFITMLMILTISVTAFAALTETSAREIASKWMPDGTTYRLTKEDADEFEVYFFNKSLNTNYKVEINKFSAAITEISGKVQDAHGSTIVNISEQQIQAIVMNEFPDATIQKIALDTEDDYQVYEIKFTRGTSQGDMEINPENGSIIKWEIKY